MKLNFPCDYCHLEYNKEIRTEIDLNDDGVYEITCSNGHEKTYFVENDKYQVLFDLGLLAIENSFYREAVSSLAASLERFYEYCIKVMLVSKGTNMSDINKTWKTISNMSERQVGAFNMLFLSTFNEVPVVFNNKMIKFRNDVIHKGYIPTKEKVLKYADEVHTFIISHLLKLKESHQPSMDKYVLARKSDLVQKYSNSSMVTCRFGTTINSYFIESKLNVKKSVYYLTQSFYPIYIR